LTFATIDHTKLNDGLGSFGSPLSSCRSSSIWPFRPRFVRYYIRRPAGELRLSWHWFDLLFTFAMSEMSIGRISFLRWVIAAAPFFRKFRGGQPSQRRFNPSRFRYSRSPSERMVPTM
jgi:hypothetical protein